MKVVVGAGLIAIALGAVALGVSSHAAPTASPLAGTWALVAADVLHADGTRAHDYGETPKGLLIVDDGGRYSLQIFSPDRPHFASNDKTAGTPAEYKTASLGASTHFGILGIDSAGGTLTFKIDAASYPNWEGASQTRQYKLEGDELSYRGPPRPNGDVPISIWRRLK